MVNFILLQYFAADRYLRCTIQLYLHILGMHTYADVRVQMPCACRQILVDRISLLRCLADTCWCQANLVRTVLNRTHRCLRTNALTVEKINPRNIATTADTRTHVHYSNVQKYSQDNNNKKKQHTKFQHTFVILLI